MSDSWHNNIKNKNREEIIAAARELFLKHNFINVNIKDVCTLAGVSRVTFYKHFQSIDELIFEVQIDILVNMDKAIKTGSEAETCGKDKLKSMLYAWINFAKNNEDQIRYITLFDIYYGAYNSNEQLKSNFDKFVSVSNKDFIDKIISDGIKDGSFKEDIDPVNTAYCIFQTIMGVLQRMSCARIPNIGKEVTYDDITFSVANMIINSIKREDKI